MKAPSYRRIRAAVVLLGAGALLAAGMLLPGLPATANTVDPPEDGWAALSELGFPVPTAAEAQAAVTAYEHRPALMYTYERSVSTLESVEVDGSEKVISLAADILFAPDKWDLPASAPKRLQTLLADVPDGVSLAVHGHTDSVAGAVDNQELSEKRARAVGEAIAQVRPDLVLEVDGFAATKPKQKESGSDDEAAKRANRRVELRYEG